MVYICYIIENYRECRNIIGYTEKGGFPSIFFPSLQYVIWTCRNQVTNFEKKIQADLTKQF